MALSEQKRQQKQQRRKAKEKKRALAHRQGQLAATSPAALDEAPILDSFTLEELWLSGMGNVLVSRRLLNGEIAVGMFLVDRYCLGVKDAMWQTMSSADYRGKLLRRVAGAGRCVDISPEFARKIVEGAVEYARKLGFAPHRDYHKAKRIFGRIDAAATDEKIAFGSENGRPMYIRGPHDSEHRDRQIIDTLTASCGEDNFSVVLMM
jgi:hypothetical protein